MYACKAWHPNLRSYISYTLFQNGGQSIPPLPARQLCLARVSGTEGFCCQPWLPMRGAAWAILALLGPVASIKVSIHLPAREKKCFGEQAARLELLVVELSASEGSKVGVTVLSPHATIFSEHDRQQVKTAFTTQDAGPHWICIQNDEATDAEVLLSVLLGPEAKDYSQIAKKEHLEESKVTLRRVADALQNYHSNVLYIRAREERMRKTNDSTASRVIFFCLFNVVLMIGVGGWQMLYFKSFFRSKKII